jgi:hypothetical protein
MRQRRAIELVPAQPPRRHHCIHELAETPIVVPFLDVNHLMHEDVLQAGSGFRALLRMARDEWQWLDGFPKIRLLPRRSGARPVVDARGSGKAFVLLPASPRSGSPVCSRDGLQGERDKRLGMEPGGSGAKDRLAQSDQEWNAARRAAELGRGGRAGSAARRHERFCFTYQGRPIAWEMTNSAWHTAFAEGRHQGLPIPRSAPHVGVVAPAGRNELRRVERLGRLEVQVMVDRYAKYATEHLVVAAAPIEESRGGTVIKFPTFSPRSTQRRA